MCLLQGNATEWETATGNNSIFHRALANPEHFSAECAATVIMSPLRADKLIQKEVQTVWRESHLSVLLEYIFWTYFLMCFEATLLNVTVFYFFFFRDETRGAGENPYKFFSTPLLFSLIIPLEIFFRLFSLSVRSVLGHFPSNPWRFCQSSILSLALIL